MKEKSSFELLKDVDVYKWLKVIQALILIALGVIFIATNVSNEEGNSGQALGYSVAVILSLYGLLELFAGYLFHRSVFNQEIIFGTVAIALSISVYANPLLVNNLLLPFLVGAIFTYSAVLIVGAIDEFTSKKSEKRSNIYGVLEVILAVILIAAAIVFLVFNANEGEQVIRYLIIVVGGVLIVLGLFLLVRSLVKASATKKLLKEGASTPISHKKKEETPAPEAETTHIEAETKETEAPIEATTVEEEDSKLLTHNDSSADNAIEEHKEN